VLEEDNNGDYHVFETLPNDAKWKVSAGNIGDFV
jgi:hypothetical protein